MYLSIYIYMYLSLLLSVTRHLVLEGIRVPVTLSLRRWGSRVLVLASALLTDMHTKRHLMIRPGGNPWANGWLFESTSKQMLPLKRWRLGEIDLRFALNSTPGWVDVTLSLHRWGNRVLVLASALLTAMHTKRHLMMWT